MEFRILGPLEVSAGGRTVDLGGPKQRALLALLLIEANRVVSNDRLIEALWESGAPDTAQKALQVYVSQLRKLVGRERLETKPPGYLLRVDPGELDLERFQSLLEEGRLRDALAVWRGAPLSDFTYQRFAQPEIGRLEELRLACLEQRIDDDLAGGRHDRLIGELEALATANPHRERVHAQLMLALYRCGRQAEALAVYQALRAALVEELGIEPSRELRELHQAVLNQDSALEPAASAGRSSPRPPEPQASPPAEPAESPETRKVVSAVSVVLEVAAAGGARIDPEALRRVTEPAGKDVNAAAERHGGTIESIGGDTITVVFGLPAVHEDDALRAVRAALEMRDLLAARVSQLEGERALELAFRIGISTGEVVAGREVIGSFRATGEPLAAAARLAQAAGAGEAVLDDRTYGLLRDAVVAHPAEAGRRIVELADVAAAKRLASPMVGRDRERRRLHDAFEQAVADRSCHLFTVLGLAGVGKSRLVQEFVDDVGSEALVARGRCLPYGEGITFWPLAEAIKEAVGLDDADSPDEARTKVLAALADDSGSGTVAQRVAETIGLAEATGSVEERLRAVSTLFEALARTRPLVVVFDDIHWAEPTFLDLVEHLAEWTREAPILLVCLARPELIDIRPGWGGGKLNATAALLEPLSDDECSSLVRNLLGAEAPADAVAPRIAEAAEGNPLFVEEMLSMLIDDGLLVRGDGGWTASEEIASIRVPPTINALLAARLDQLGASERAVIERAAVSGKVFQEDAVLELSPEVLRPKVADALGSLLRKQLIRPGRAGLGGRTYRFRHLLIRDAAYDSIPKQARAGLHEGFARWLDEAAGERSTEYEEVVGYHLEQAYGYRVEVGAIDDDARVLAYDAAQRLGNSGRRAFTRSDIPAGTNLTARAVALLAPDDPLRVELIPNIRAVQGMGADLSWAESVLTEAADLAAETGDGRLAANALVQRGLLRLFTAEDVTPDELSSAAETSILAFEEIGDALGLARAWRLKAQALYLARRAGACADASEIAFAHALRARDRFEEREILEWLVVSLLLGPVPAAEAAGRCERLLRDTAGDPLLEPHLLGALAPLAAMQGRIADANELVTRCRHVMESSGEWIWIVSLWCAMASLWQDDPAVAEAHIRPGYEALKGMGEKSHFSAFAHELADIVYKQGRYDEAAQIAQESQDASRPNDVNAHIICRSTQAKVLARLGKPEAGQRLAREALAFASETDFLPARATALMDYAEVLRLAGDAEGSAVAVDEAVRLYELKGNAVGAARARALLGERLGSS